jgi:hypothetical protein
MWDMATAAQGSCRVVVGPGASTDQSGPTAPPPSHGPGFAEADTIRGTSETTPPPSAGNGATGTRPTPPPTSPNGASPRAEPFTGYGWRFKVLAAVMLTVAFGALVLAYQRVSDDDGDPIVRSGGTSAFVEALLPARDSQVVQQTTVGIDLASGWDGTLVVDGREVPDDQLVRRPSLNRVEFTPGEGRVVAALPAGRQCVRAIVWETRVGRGGGSRDVRWCFEVV